MTYDELADNSGGWTYSDLLLRPLVGYMWEGESPLFVLHSKANPITVIDKTSDRGWEIEFQSGNDNRAQLLLSDARFLFAFWRIDHPYDSLISIPHNLVESISVATEKEAPGGARALVVETDAIEYILPVSADKTEERLEKIVDAAGDLTGSGGAEPVPDDPLLTIAALVLASGSSDDIDKIVSEGESAQEVLTSITDELRQGWEERVADKSVRRADSLSDLLSIEGAVPERVPSSNQEGLLGGDITKVGAAGVAGAGVATTVQAAIENADLAQVAMTGIETGKIGLPAALAAPWSTPLVLGALVTTGVATELYKSANDGTVVDDIDPAEVVRRATSGAKAGDKYDIGGYDGRKIGATLSAARYLAENLTPEEHLDLLMQSDPELMLEGAELGVELSNKGEFSMGEGVGAATGMAVGLRKSYESDTSTLSEDDLRDVLDEDLYHQYVGATNLEEGG